MTDNTIHGCLAQLDNGIAGGLAGGILGWQEEHNKLSRKSVPDSLIMASSRIGDGRR